MDTRCRLGHHLVESRFFTSVKENTPDLFVEFFPSGLGVFALLCYCGFYGYDMWPGKKYPLKQAKTSEALRSGSCVSRR